MRWRSADPWSQIGAYGPIQRKPDHVYSVGVPVARRDQPGVVVGLARHRHFVSSFAKTIFILHRIILAQGRYPRGYDLRC